MQLSRHTDDNEDDVHIVTGGKLYSDGDEATSSLAKVLANAILLSSRNE